MFRLVLLGALLALPPIYGQNPESSLPTPVIMFRTTIKSWRSMYRSYREEIDLGYCWADYFVDVRRLINTLSGPKTLGPEAGDPQALRNLLRRWLDEPKTTPKPLTVVDALWNGLKATTRRPDEVQGGGANLGPPGGEDAYLSDEAQADLYDDDSTVQGQSTDEDGAGYDLVVDEYNPIAAQQIQPLQPVRGQPIYGRFVYPGTSGSRQNVPLAGIQEYLQRGVSRRNFAGTAKIETADEPESVAGYADPRTAQGQTDTGSDFAATTLVPTGRAADFGPRGLSDLIISALGFDTPPGVGALQYGQQRNTAMIIFARIVGTFFRVGRQVMETIDGTSILACTKNYLSTKFFRWIDS